MLRTKVNQADSMFALCQWLVHIKGSFSSLDRLSETCRASSASSPKVRSMLRRGSPKGTLAACLSDSSQSAGSISMFFPLTCRFDVVISTHWRFSPGLANSWPWLRFFASSMMVRISAARAATFPSTALSVLSCSSSSATRCRRSANAY